MPNHIANTIELIGSLSAIKKVVESFNTYLEAKPRVSFNGKICYEHRENKSRGWLNKETNIFTARVDGEIVESEFDDSKWEVDIEPAWNRFPDFDKIVPMPKNIQETIGEPGLNPDWYDWSCQNWGTKWNSYECKKLAFNKFYFETAWSGVPKLIHKMAVKFPDVVFVYKYSDEDFGSNCGSMVFCDDKYDEIEVEDRTNEAYEIAFDLRPHYKGDFEFKDGKWSRKENV
jgi:hypothetical protein